MNKVERREYKKQWYATNREKRLKQMKEYYASNRERLLKQHKEYKNTPMGRASYLLMQYNREDKKRGRGEGDLTAKWIVDNIFTKPCAHCGKTGWEVIGCNRINNDLPHTKDNVEPCCYECNVRLNIGDKKKQVFQYSLDGELVRVWESLAEAGRNGFNSGAVSNCCNGKYKTSKGYKWSYTPPPS